MEALLVRLLPRVPPRHKPHCQIVVGLVIQFLLARNPQLQPNYIQCSKVLTLVKRRTIGSTFLSACFLR